MITQSIHPKAGIYNARNFLLVAKGAKGERARIHLMLKPPDLWRQPEAVQFGLRDFRVPEDAIFYYDEPGDPPLPGSKKFPIDLRYSLNVDYNCLIRHVLHK